MRKNIGKYTTEMKNPEEQPFRGAKRWRGEEQIMTKQMTSLVTTDAQAKKNFNGVWGGGGGVERALKRSVGKLLGITKTRLFKYSKHFTIKQWNFQMKNSSSFHISAQNIDCGFSLEPPRRGGSNKYTQSMFWVDIWRIMHTPCKPHFYCIKVGFKGVKAI